MPVIDASVYVSLCNETDPWHDRCLRWLEDRSMHGETLSAPNLLLVEVAAAIRRITGEQDLARRVVTELEVSGLVEFIPLTPKRSSRGARVAMETGVRGADAVYLALAQELDEPLITLDRQQLKRGRAIARVESP